MNYDCILVEVQDKVGLIRLNRPKAFNALSDQLMDELGDALLKLDADENVGCIVLTGNEKAFAAGADIVAMAGLLTWMSTKTSTFRVTGNIFGAYASPLLQQLPASRWVGAARWR